MQHNELNNENIDSLLFTRYLSKKIRMAGGRIKGPSKREKKYDELFEKVLRENIENQIKREQENGTETKKII